MANRHIVPMNGMWVQGWQAVELAQGTWMQLQRFRVCGSVGLVPRPIFVPLSCFKAQNIRTEGKHLYRPGVFKEERDIFSSERASSDKTKHLEFRLCGLGISRISRGKGGGDLPARERICQSQLPIFVSVSTIQGIMAALRSLRIWVDAIWTWE